MKPVRSRPAVLFGVVFSAALLVAPLSPTGMIHAEKKRSIGNGVSIRWDDLPPAVRTAATRSTQGAQLVAFERLASQGPRSFRIRASKSAVDFALIFDRRGKLLSFQLERSGKVAEPAVRANSFTGVNSTRNKLDADDDGDDDEDREKGQRKVSLQEVPVAARKALVSLARPASIKRVEVQGKDGRRSFEASWRTRTGWREAVVTVDGQLLETSESVKRSRLPSAVKAVASKIRNKDEVEFTKKVVVLYEIEYEQGDRETEILVDARGRRIEIERDDDDDDKHKSSDRKNRR